MTLKIVCVSSWISGDSASVWRVIKQWALERKAHQIVYGGPLIFSLPLSSKLSAHLSWTTRTLDGTSAWTSNCIPPYLPIFMGRRRIGNLMPFNKLHSHYRTTRTSNPKTSWRLVKTSDAVFSMTLPKQSINKGLESVITFPWEESMNKVSRLLLDRDLPAARCRVQTWDHSSVEQIIPVGPEPTKMAVYYKKSAVALFLRRDFSGAIVHGSAALVSHSLRNPVNNHQLIQ